MRSSNRSLWWSQSVGDREIEWALATCADASVAVAWRTRFRPATRAVVEECVHDADVNLIFRRVGTLDPVCLFQVHDLDARFWHAQISALGDPAHRGSPLMGQALVLGMAVAFALCPLRKVYAESLDWAPDGERDLRYLRHFEREGTLRGHVCVDGAWSDVHLHAMWRDTFGSVAPERLQVRAREWVDELLQ